MTEKNHFLTEEEFWTKALEAHGSDSSHRFYFDDLVLARNIVQRKLWLQSVILGDDDCTINDLSKAIMAYNADDDGAGLASEQRKPIRLYINCNGGDIFNGMHLIDVIRCSKTPVYTIVQGGAYSMAFHIAITGHKRFAMENSVFLVHDGEILIGNSASKTDDFMKFNKLFQERLDNMVVERTKITREMLKEKERVDWYMIADQALEYGIIDKIITPETGMAEIL